MLPWQPIKLNNFDKSLMKCGELFNKHFCKNKIQLSLMRPQKLPISTFQNYKSIETLSYHSNEISQTLTIKKHMFVEINFISMYAKF